MADTPDSAPRRLYRLFYQQTPVDADGEPISDDLDTIAAAQDHARRLEHLLWSVAPQPSPSTSPPLAEYPTYYSPLPQPRWDAPPLLDRHIPDPPIKGEVGQSFAVAATGAPVATLRAIIERVRDLGSAYDHITLSIPGYSYLRLIAFRALARRTTARHQRRNKARRHRHG